MNTLFEDSRKSGYNGYLVRAVHNRSESATGLHLYLTTMR